MGDGPRQLRNPAGQAGGGRSAGFQWLGLSKGYTSPSRSNARTLVRGCLLDPRLSSFGQKIASKRSDRISWSGDLSCRELLESCRGLSSPQGWPFHRHGPKRTSTRESRQSKFSQTPATRATAVRGKSSRPAQHFCGSTTPRVRGKRRLWSLISPRSAVMRRRFSSGPHPHWARDGHHPQRSISPSPGMLRQRSLGTATRRRGNRLAAIPRSSGGNPLPRAQH